MLLVRGVVGRKRKMSRGGGGWTFVLHSIFCCDWTPILVMVGLGWRLLYL